MAGQEGAMKKVWVVPDGRRETYLLLPENVIVDEVVKAAYAQYNLPYRDAIVLHNGHELRSRDMPPDTVNCSIEIRSNKDLFKPAPVSDSPSTFGESKWYKRNDFLLHRPSWSQYGCHVSLFYEGFGQFIKDCHNAEQLDVKDFEFATEVSKEMGKHYCNEKEHVEAFTDLLCEYFN